MLLAAQSNALPAVSLDLTVSQPLYTWGKVNAAIRAQIQGYLIKRNYTEGEFVRKGQILFEIDPRTFRAALDQAKGQATEQRARWEMARANLERIKPLVEQKAVSLKDLDDAMGAEQATRAALVAAQAVVEKAQVDCGFTTIISPIDGIAGIARTQIGNLVGPGSIEELTTVSTVDPIKVYVPLSEQEYRKSLQTGGGQNQRMPLELILSNASESCRTSAALPDQPRCSRQSCRSRQSFWGSRRESHGSAGARC